MKPLDKAFITRLDEIAETIQNSEQIKQFQEDEEEESYQALRDTFEESIANLYEEVAENHPLQLFEFELALTDPKFEGLFLPRLLGFAVLRGEINDNYKYIRPQKQFKDILLAICNSFNFDYIRKRIGQTIQIGFSLSSDIWITNLVAQIANKKIRYFLQGQNLPRYRVLAERRATYVRYSNQFKNENYFSVEFPTTQTELSIYFTELKKFLFERIKRKGNDESFKPEIHAFIENKNFKNSRELLELIALYGAFYPFTDKEKDLLGKTIARERKDNPKFQEEWFSIIKDLHNGQLDLQPENERQLSELFDKGGNDDIGKYYTLTDIIHTKGYISPEAIEAVQASYVAHPGLSDINENTRLTIFAYFKRFLMNVSEDEYQDYFELSKSFPPYMQIFDNEQFNHNLKGLCMKYVKRLLKRYTDKRGKDYQEIKKFVAANFLDLGFLTSKQITELFKSRRKKKPVAPTK